MNVQQRINFTEVIRELDYQKLLKPGTIIITDFDNTFITYAEEAENLFKFQPERIPDTILAQVKKITAKGAKLAIATNRPKEGFKLAETMADLLGDYPVFPETLEKMGVEVFGGGPLFMFEKFKKTDDAFYMMKSWLLTDAEHGGAGITNDRNITIVGIGDRKGDMDFFTKLQDIIDNDYPDVSFIIYKLPGLIAEDNPDTGGIIHKVIRFIMRFIP